MSCRALGAVLWPALVGLWLKNIFLPAPFALTTGRGDAAEELRGAETGAEGVQRMVLRRAIVSGAANLISVPGTDIAVDYIVLRDLLKAVNKRFGLNEAQIDKYDDWTKMLIFKMIKKGRERLWGKWQRNSSSFRH